MIDHARESRAFRRELIAGLLGFVLGFAAIQVGTIYLLAQYIAPESGAWSAVGIGLHALPFTFAAALGCALAPMRLLQRRHYRRGVYRCFMCGRALRDTATWCECRTDIAPIAPRPRRPIRHYRRRIKPVLLAYLAVVPLALILADYAPGRGGMPFALYALGFHVLLCVLGGTLVKLACAVLEMCQRGRRFRLRAAVFLRMLAVWPALVIIGAMVAKALGYE